MPRRREGRGRPAPCQYRNDGSVYNCGRCEKCLRTMINLRAAGVSELCPTLPAELDYDAVAGMDAGPRDTLFADENLRELRRTGRDPRLAEALETAVARWHGAPHPS